MNCPVCYDGHPEERLVDKWMRQGDHWVLFRNVPALVCDLCGDTTFSQDTSARLLKVLRSNAPETTRIFVPVYDLQLIDAAAEMPKIEWLTAVSPGPQDSSTFDSAQWRVFQSAGVPKTETPATA